MAKKQFDNVVTNITRPERVSSISELFDDDQNIPHLNSTNPHAIEVNKKQNEDLIKIENNKIQPIIIQESQEKNKLTTVFRDGFSMPEQDYELIGASIKKAGLLGYSINKSEVLRAGLQALSKLKDDQFLQYLQNLIKIKPGRKVG